MILKSLLPPPGDFKPASWQPGSLTDRFCQTAIWQGGRGLWDQGFSWLPCPVWTRGICGLPSLGLFTLAAVYP